MSYSLEAVIGPDAINRVLKLLGVKCEAGKDEFDTVGMGGKRSTEAWAGA